MLDILTQSEAVAVLCLLMIGADDEIRPEELTAMLDNPFFVEYITENIRPHKDFLLKFNTTKEKHGEQALEEKAIHSLKDAFPAYQLKTLALMMLIAGADDHYDQQEKELLARVAVKLGVEVDTVQPELERMRRAVLTQKVQPSDT